MVLNKLKELLGGKGEIDLGDLPLGGYEKYLDGVTYPIGIDDLLVVIKNNGAPEQLLKLIQGVATGGKSSFASQEEVVDTVKSAAKNMI